MKHIINALVENKPGVLAHVAGMFAARAFNIDSLVVGRHEHLDASVLERVRPMLAALASRITHMGPVGAGQATKAVNQIMAAGINQAVTEALAPVLDA